MLTCIRKWKGFGSSGMWSATRSVSCVRSLKRIHLTLLHHLIHSYPPLIIPALTGCPTGSILCHVITHTAHSMSSSRELSISSVSPLTSENYRLWADHIKSCLQLNGLWRLVSGSEKKPAGKPKVLDSKGAVISAAVPTDEDKLIPSLPLTTTISPCPFLYGPSPSSP